MQAFILSSKFVYSIFQCRKTSILGPVAHNQFGPNLPQAMWLVRYLGGTHFSGFGQDFTITRAQIRILRHHASIVRALEDIYSWQ